MRDLHETAAEPEGTMVEGGKTEKRERDGGADDIDDRIDRADLVKMHAPRTHAVDLPLGLADDAEGRRGELPDARLERRAIDHPEDSREIAPPRRPGAADARAMRHDRAVLHAISGDREPFESGKAPHRSRDPRRVGAEAEETGEEHVAGEPPRRIDDDHAGGFPRHRSN